MTDLFILWMVKRCVTWHCRNDFVKVISFGGTKRMAAMDGQRVNIMSMKEVPCW